MTPMLDRVRVTRRLRYTEKWYLLEPKQITWAHAWLTIIRDKYWLPCANCEMQFEPNQFELLLTEFGNDLLEIQDFKKNLKLLDEAVKTNDRPFFFKIAKVNKKIKEIERCQKS